MMPAWQYPHEAESDVADHWRPLVDWRLYADRSRFTEVPKERFFVIQGAIRRREGKVFGANWHVFLETCDFDAAWASVPRPGIVVTEREIRDDPILQPLLDEWRSGNDSSYQRFLQHVLDWTEDEYDPN
jgi:hypothetical protein